MLALLGSMATTASAQVNDDQTSQQHRTTEERQADAAIASPASRLSAEEIAELQRLKPNTDEVRRMSHVRTVQYRTVMRPAAPATQPVYQQAAPAQTTTPATVYGAIYSAAPALAAPIMAAPVFAQPVMQAINGWQQPVYQQQQQQPVYYQQAAAAQPATYGGGDPYGFLGWLNSVRASYGLGAVGYDANLESWAAMNNAQQAARGLGHFVMGPARRQNAAIGSSASIGSQWMNSAAHRAALLDPSITAIGLAGSGQYWTFNAR